VSRAQWNLVVDAIMVLLIGAVAGLGFLMKFVLLPGEQLHEQYGPGAALQWMGMNRHEWGTVHLWLGISLLAMLALHILLHWGQVLGMLCVISHSLVLRLAIVLAVILAAALLMSIALWAKPELTSGKAGQGHRWGQRQGSALHGQIP